MGCRRRDERRSLQRRGQKGCRERFAEVKRCGRRGTEAPRFSFEPFPKSQDMPMLGDFEGPVFSAAPPSEYIPLGGAVAL